MQENLKKDIDELQEEYERVTWANNLKVGDEVLVRYHSEWKEKNKVEEIYENYYVVNCSKYNTDGMLIGNNGFKLYPPIGKYIKEYERIELVKGINDAIKNQEDNEKLKDILKIINLYFKKDVINGVVYTYTLNH